jgi:hypothetical protein
MIHMELGPSTIVGLGLSIVGLLLYLIRTNKPNVSRDYDLFFSSVGLLCGGILIFQGWRLDPILLLCQILSSGTALFFIGESLWLRGANEKNKDVLVNIISNKEKKTNNSNIVHEQISVSTKVIYGEIKNYQEQKLVSPSIRNNSWGKIHYTIPLDYTK